MTLPGHDRISGMTKKAINAKDAFLDLMKKYSSENTTKSKGLERTFGLSGSEIRALIHCHRIEGQPIASDANGYFYARKAPELETTKAHILARIRALKEIYDALGRTQEVMSSQEDLFVSRGDAG